MFSDLIHDIDNYSTEPDLFLDAPFVPTDDAVIEAMLNLAQVNAKDILYDLGSGDGRILITAAKERHTRGVGIDIDPRRIADAMECAAQARVEYLVDFLEEDIFNTDFSEATVVTLYLLDTINIRLRPQLLRQLRPGAHIISHLFNMGDWQADMHLELGGINIYKWVVPAKVAGAWEWVGLNGDTYYVELEQTYQEVTGNAWLGDQAVELKSAMLCANTLELIIQENETPFTKHFTLNFENNESRFWVRENGFRI